VSAYEIPATGSAEVHVLNNGYVGLDGDDERVSGTVTLIIDSGAVIVVDPGMAGHTAEDISTVASTADGVHVCTHAWWTERGPEVDPLATDAAALTVSRDLLLSFAAVIIPGHGAPFRPFRAVSPS
jgi:glyoxylase-like metal-dependent hydrolase (beta-lactamase superfamily II)